MSAPRFHETSPTHPGRTDAPDAIASTDVGRVIENPVSGERIIIRESGAQNGGRLLVFDLYLPPGGHVPAGHTHPSQEERFIVVAGQMRFRMGRHSLIVRPGETITIPAGRAHWFGAVGAAGAQARVEVRPALRMQELFETTERLGRGARLMWAPNLARIALDFQREVAVPHLPTRLVRAALAPLAWLARRAE